MILVERIFMLSLSTTSTFQSTLPDFWLCRNTSLSSPGRSVETWSNERYQNLLLATIVLMTMVRVEESIMRVCCIVQLHYHCCSACTLCLPVPVTQLLSLSPLPLSLLTLQSHVTCFIISSLTMHKSSFGIILHNFLITTPSKFANID